MAQTFPVRLACGDYPTLYKAWYAMLLDNTGSPHIIGQSTEKIERVTLQFPHDPVPAEAELAKLSEEELDTLCTGDEDDRPDVSPETEAILTYLFEAL